MIGKDGDRLIVSSAPKKRLLAALRRLGPLPEEDRMPTMEDFHPVDRVCRGDYDREASAHGSGSHRAPQPPQDHPKIKARPRAA